MSCCCLQVFGGWPLSGDVYLLQLRREGVAVTAAGLDMSEQVFSQMEAIIEKFRALHGAGEPLAGPAACSSERSPTPGTNTLNNTWA